MPDLFRYILFGAAVTGAVDRLPAHAPPAARATTFPDAVLSHSTPVWSDQ